MRTVADMKPTEFLLSWGFSGAIAGCCWNYALATSFQQNLPWYVDFALGLITPPIGFLFALLSWAFETFGQFPVTG